MNNEFICALKQTIGKFGKDIVKEKRFVDIVSDYYPGMAVDHPALKKVLTAIIVEGFGNDILVCNNSVDARLCVDKYNVLVSKKNGFEKKLVESILLELCSVLSISVAIPSTTRPIKPVNSQQNRKQNPASAPLPNGKPVQKPKSSRHAKKAPRHTWTKHNTLIIFTAIVAILIMAISAIYTYNNCYLWIDVDFPTWSVVILTAVIWIYLVYIFQESRSGWGIAFIILFISFIISLALICIPQEIVQKTYQHAYMEKLREKIKTNNENRKAIKENHLKENRSLGFMGINIDGKANILHEMRKFGMLEKETTWTEKFNTVNISTGSIFENNDSIYAQDVLDSVLLFQTKWDSKNIEIKVGIHNNKILALEIYPRKIDFYDDFNNDSVLNIYKAKYGMPEEITDEFWESIIKHSSIKIKDAIQYATSGRAFSDIITSHMWSFKNGYVILYREGDMSLSLSNIDKILYISKELETLQKRHILVEKKKDIIRKQNLKKEKNRQQQEINKKKEKEYINRQREHAKAVNQI